MRIDEALKAAKAGYRLRREGWQASQINAYWVLIDGKLTEVSADGVHGCAQLTTEDLAADDWTRMAMECDGTFCSAVVLLVRGFKVRRQGWINPVAHLRLSEKLQMDMGHGYTNAVLVASDLRADDWCEHLS